MLFTPTPPPLTPHPSPEYYVDFGLLYFFIIIAIEKIFQLHYFVEMYTLYGI